MGQPKFATIPEAVEILELQGKYKRPDRWLIRTLRAREVALKIRILLADQSGKGARYRVNLATARLALHEIQDPQELIVSGILAKLDGLAKQIAKLDGRVNDLESSLGVLADAERKRNRGIR